MNYTNIETNAVQRTNERVETEAVQDLSDLQLAMVGGGIADVIAG